MRRCRGAGLAALAALLIVAVVRAQVQQEPFLETTEGTSISIKCSHPNIRTADFIHFYRQLPGQRPEFLAMTVKQSKELRSPEGRLSVSTDRRSSALWLGRPRRGDAAVYYCALGATGRGAGAAAGHEPPRAGPGGASRGRCRSARRAPGAPPRPARPGLPAPEPTPAPPMGPGPIPGPIAAPTTHSGTHTNAKAGTDADTDTNISTHTDSSSLELPTVLCPSPQPGLRPAELLSAANKPARPQLHVHTEMLCVWQGGQLVLDLAGSTSASRVSKASVWQGKD
ncbi:uncharacterized protein LOC121359580 [Pyrgilauda ruficollis]|uniref:uncharacterized protein LOC121359580 n=1 Tax=Pyrgilauda ruficollis TaxID=221976 RepID=UPI001B86E9E0|nr:uncharacterized protein LOC121359580 [Pyrgilauda ruficollis]